MPRQLSTESVIQRSVRAGALLTTRSFFLRLLGGLGAIAMSRLFLPNEFGFLAVANGFLGMFGLFGNIGMGAAIIRNSQEPSEADYEAAFCVQMIFVALFTAFVWLSADWFAAWLMQDVRAAWPIRVASLTVLGGALQLPPRIGLEREMLFGPLVLVELAELISFYGVVILLGFLGLGIWSIAIAIVLRAFVGIPIVYRSFGRLILPRWRQESVQKLIGFGAAFQGGSIINALRESFTPMFIAAIGGPIMAGYYGWARGIVEWEMAIFNGLWKVGYPSFARLPNNPELHRQAAQRVLALVSLVTFPLTAFWILFGQDVISTVFGKEWLPAYALSAIMLAGLSISGTISVATAGLILVRAGANRILIIQTAHTAAFFAITLPLLPNYGLTSIGIGWLVSNVVDAWLLLKFSADARPSLRPLLPALLSSIAGLAVGVGLAQVTTAGWVGLCTSALGAGVAGFGVLLLCGRSELLLARQTAVVMLPGLQKHWPFYDTRDLSSTISKVQ